MTRLSPTSFPVLASGATLLTSLLASTPAVAAPPTKDQCVDANTRAQDLRRDAKLLSARQELKKCVVDACPKLVRVDCASRLEELETAMPSIVFEAKDRAGHDLSAVNVAVDDQPLLEQLDGSAVELDPGEHTFVFRSAGQPPASETWVIREGDKGRREAVTIGLPLVAPTLAARPAPAPSVATQSPRPNPRSRLLAIGLGASGVAGIGLGAAFGLDASSRWSTSKNECRSPESCPNRAAALSDHDHAQTSAAISTVAFIAGGALLAAGSALFILDWKRRERPVATLRLLPIATTNGAGLWLGGAL